MAKLITPFDIDHSKIRKILIRSPNWVGDTVMCTPAITALRANFPHAYIAVVVRPWVKDILSGNPYLDELIPYSWTSLGRYLRFIGMLRKKEFDMGILFPNSFSSAWMFFLAGIPYRVGYNTQGRGFLLTHKIPFTRNYLREYQVDYYLRIAYHLGNKRASRNFYLRVSEEAEEYSAQLLKKHGVREGDFLVGFNPGGSFGPAKRWPARKFAGLGNVLVRQYGVKIILFGSPQEVKLVEKVKRKIRYKVIMTAGKTSLEQLSALIKNCSLFITNDTGPLHIAIALNVPVVAIFGPTDPGKVLPRTGEVVAVRKELSCSPCGKRECPWGNECLEEISVEEVIKAAAPFLPQKGKHI